MNGSEIIPESSVGRRLTLRIMKLLCLAIVLLLASVAVIRAAEPQVIHLWPNGAPGFEDRRNEPEQAKDHWLRNIHNPSITVFPAPPEQANGAAVLIVPGGGHRELVFNAEGVEPAKYLNDLGVTCFVLKHRLARETNSPYSLQIHPRQDVKYFFWFRFRCLLFKLSITRF